MILNPYSNRVIKCKISAEDKKLYLFHTFDANLGICREHRLDTRFTATHPNIVIDYKTFRFNGVGGADQKQTVECALKLDLSESITTSTTIPDCASDCRNACSCDENSAECQNEKDIEKAVLDKKAEEAKTSTTKAPTTTKSTTTQPTPPPDPNATGLGEAYC